MRPTRQALGASHSPSRGQSDLDSSAEASTGALTLSQLATGRHFILLYETGTAKSFVDAESLDTVMAFLLSFLENNVLKYAGIGGKSLYYNENDVAAFVASFDVLTLLALDPRTGAYRAHGPQHITRLLLRYVRGK